MLKKFLIAAAIGAIIIVILPMAIAFYLSPQSELAKTDAIVVISGGDTDARINEGVKMYLQEWAPKIIFSGAAAEGTVSNALAMKRIAIQKGVPASSILIEEDSKTTEENAIDTAKLIKDYKISSIILITSPYHQRRAYEAFKKELGNNFTIINHSATDVNWAKKSWWEDPRARFLTFGEMMKNFYILIFKRG